MKIASIEDLIAYRLRNEKLISKIFVKNYYKDERKKYEQIIYENILNKAKNFVIKKGKLNSKKTIRIRVVSSNIKNLNSVKKDPKVRKSLLYLDKFSSFILIVINNKKDEKSESENAILRYYGIGAQIIKDLKVRNMILVTRERKKIIGLEGFGLKIKKQEIIK